MDKVQFTPIKFRQPELGTLEKLAFSALMTVFVSLGTPASAQNLDPAKPNVLLIYADDLGYGDVGAYNPTAKIPTPNMDRLRSEGMLFRNAHSGSAVCTPSRYSLLTGRYCWRLSSDGILPSGVIWDYSISVIRSNIVTIGQMLQSNGYRTACFGKWHLGMQHYQRNGTPFTGIRNPVASPTEVDMTRVTDTPVDRGFDYFWGMPNTINIPPYTWMENRTILFQSEPATLDTPWTIRAPPSAGSSGLADPSLDFFQISPITMEKAVRYIENRSTNPEPFFVYLSLFSPHTPHIPTQAFQGSVGYLYGDYVHETDHWMGQVINALTNNGLAGNTLVIVTSDNGPEVGAFNESANFGHDSNGPLRGLKRDSWEGGTRVPFLVRWPGKVATNSTTDHLIWQGDIFATLADLLGAELAPGEAVDSESFLPALLDQTFPDNGRDSIVLASSGNQLSLYTTNGWKLIDGTGGGGNNSTIFGARGAIGGSPKQLFNLNADLAEANNLQADYPALVTTLMDRLTVYRTTDSSTIHDLTIRAGPDPGELILSWPNVLRYDVQEASAIAGPYRHMVGTISTAQRRNEMTIAASDNQRFYRLKRFEPLAITEQPQSLGAAPGQDATFNVTATGTGLLTYQWRQDGTDIATAVSSSHTVTNAGFADEGEYSVVVTDFFGSITSDPATFTLLIPPVIVQDLRPQTVTVGESVTFTVTVTNTATRPITYRWRRAAKTVPEWRQELESYTSSVTIPSVQSSDEALYDVIISNQAQPGGRISTRAQLTVEGQ